MWQKKSLVTYLKIALKDLRDVDVVKDTLGTDTNNSLTTFFQSIKAIKEMRNVPFVLGSISTRYLLTSDGYVSDRMIQKIDSKTSSIMENGLHQFYHSFSTYLLELKGSRFLEQDEEEDTSTLNMQQIIRPLIHHFGLLAICLGFLLIEFIIHRRQQIFRRLPCLRFLLNSSRVDIIWN